MIKVMRAKDKGGKKIGSNKLYVIILYYYVCCIIYYII